MLPSMEELRRRVEEKETKKAAQLEDHNKVYMLHINGEDVVALPYLEDPTVPDFITYKWVGFLSFCRPVSLSLWQWNFSRYPDPKQYYAEEDKPYANYE